MALVSPPNPADTTVKNPQRWDTPFTSRIPGGIRRIRRPTTLPQVAWNFSLDRLAKTPGIDPVEFDRACHDEAWGCAYSRVWRAYQELGREAA